MKCLLTVQQPQTVQTLVNHMILQSSKTPTNNEIIMNNRYTIIPAHEQNDWILNTAMSANQRKPCTTLRNYKRSKQPRTAFHAQGTGWSVQMYLTLSSILREGQSCAFRPHCATRSCNSLWQVSWSVSKHLSHRISDWQKTHTGLPRRDGTQPIVFVKGACTTVSYSSATRFPWKTRSKVGPKSTKWAWTSLRNREMFYDCL